MKQEHITPTGFPKHPSIGTELYALGLYASECRPQFQTILASNEFCRKRFMSDSGEAVMNIFQLSMIVKVKDV